ncbi:hypothetical protein RPD_3952 [Rhodopseudomonas palustris BisB5]|uniref:Uncharacterized protein n=1 Tax=Rhodopseudomonas palustris (strain BisB5) TaxID=316057 RepID=Q131R8_RHOPS|nr:hypothetical protein RPD_3952 [Rhodopseudomonas palustris BisB5]
MSGDLNPFRPTRWEHQRTGHHLIWFARTGEALTGEKSVYIRGSRGSGKTTLLKSICWEDLTRNPSLRLQRQFDDFSFVGVYIKFPDHISGSLSYSNGAKIYPHAPSPEFEMHRFFSLAVELVCLDRCLTACHDLRIAQAISMPATTEHDLVQETLREFPKLALFGDRPASFLSLAQTCRQLVREMNQACGRGTVEHISEIIPPREPGELLVFVTERLSAIVRRADNTEPSDVGFKFCLDDCEVLSPLQQRSLNTLVRMSKHPVSWVVSSVGSFFDTSGTFIDQQPLTDHDRRVETLDSRQPEEFRSLCQAVLSLRLYFSVSETTRNAYKGHLEDFFSINDRLGHRDVNDLFHAIVKASTSPLATRVASTASALRTALWDIDRRYRGRYPARSNDYPYYQAYVLLLWNGHEDAFSSDFSHADELRVPTIASMLEDQAFEAWLRRKQSAALLHFASRLGFRRLPYGGVPMITALADSSIRDFLEIVGEIFDFYCIKHKIDNDATNALDRFATSRTQIGWPIQQRGIYDASTSYLSGISNRSELDANTVTQFIDGLGQYTAVLQSNPNDPTTLGRAERGVFTVRFPRKVIDTDGAGVGAEDFVWNVIRQAELAGYIRTTAIRLSAASGKQPHDSDERIISFRLHHRFAPHFRFSHRGAYEPVALAVDDLVSLLDRINQVNAIAWAQRMASRSAKLDAGSQLSLELPGLDRED